MVDRLFAEKIIQENEWIPDDATLRRAIDHVVQAVKTYVEIVEGLRFEIGNPASESNLINGNVRHEDLFDLANLLNPELKFEREKQGVEAAAQVTGIMTGFQIGTIYGALLAGASDSELKKLANGLFVKIKSDGRYSLCEYFRQELRQGTDAQEGRAEAV